MERVGVRKLGTEHGGLQQSDAWTVRCGDFVKSDAPPSK
jgi:hypothetical protein